MMSLRYLQAMTTTLLLATAGAALAQEPAYTLDASGRITIAADGSVSDYALQDQLDESIAGLVDKTVRNWHFEPILVDGRPVIATTNMHLELEALPRDGDEFVLRVADVDFGGSTKVSHDPPQYPRDALDDRIGAKVTLVVQVDATGKVERLHVERVSLSEDSSDMRERFWRERFAKATLAAAKDWTFKNNEVIDGTPLATILRIQVAYQINNSSQPEGSGHWVASQGFIPGPYHPIPWPLANSVSAAQPGALAQGEVQALESRFELQNKVVGDIL